MKKLSIILFLIAILGVFSFAQEIEKDKNSQEKPNFSGTWIIDKQKSFSRSDERNNIENYTITIAQSGDEIKISRVYTIKNDRSSYTEILYTDKRGEKNVDKTGMTNNGEIKSKTFWKKQSVVRRFQYDKSGFGMPAYIVSGEKYSLSDDGRVLTITTEYELGSQLSEQGRAAVQQNGYSIPKRQLVFNKQE